MGELAEGTTWDEGVSWPKRPSLVGRKKVRVAIVGGGLTGMLTAYLLTRDGQSVAVMDQSVLGRGATGLTTAFVTQYLDTDLVRLLAMFGQAKTKEIIGSHGTALELLAEIIKVEKIEAEFSRCPLYVFGRRDKEVKGLRQEEAAAEELGLKTRFYEKDGLPLAQGGSLVLENQGKFHPLKFLNALAQKVTEQGGEIFENSGVKEMESGKWVKLRGQGFMVEAEKVLVATYVPFDRKLYFKKGMYKSYVIESRLPQGWLPEAIYEDADSPYHYFRVDRGKGEDRIILGGADHREQIPVAAEKNYQALEDFWQQIFPGKRLVVKRRWVGPIAEPVDGLAFIGPLENKNIFYATGFSGTGMTYAVIAAKVVTDLIRGRKSEWHKLYDAGRTLKIKPLVYKGVDYTRELLGGAGKNVLKKKA